jgi:hypothetical protein
MGLLELRFLNRDTLGEAGVRLISKRDSIFNGSYWHLSLVRAWWYRLFWGTCLLGCCALTTGCANNRHVREGLRDHGIFYPIAAGSEIAHLGSRNLWNAASAPFRGRPTTAEGIPEDELRKLEESGGMLLPPSAIFPRRVGFGNRATSFNEQERELLILVENLANRRLNWIINPSLPEIAEAHPFSVIQFNPRLLAMASYPQQLFVLLHEVGHHQRNHFGDHSLTRTEVELEADRFAADILLKLGYEPYEIFWITSLALPNLPVPVLGYPTHQERKNNIRRFLRLEAEVD